MNCIKALLVLLVLVSGGAQAYQQLPREELPITTGACLKIRAIAETVSQAIRSGTTDLVILEAMVNMGVGAQKAGDTDMRVATAMTATAVGHIRELLVTPEIAEIMATTQPRIGMDQAIGLKMMTACSHLVGTTYSTAILVTE